MKAMSQMKNSLSHLITGFMWKRQPLGEHFPSESSLKIPVPPPGYRPGSALGSPKYFLEHSSGLVEPQPPHPEDGEKQQQVSGH